MSKNKYLLIENSGYSNINLVTEMSSFFLINIISSCLLVHHLSPDFRPPSSKMTS